MLSLFIPVYNEEAILSQTISTLEAYLAPRLSEYEIIVVDNGSTDTTAQIGSELAQRTERVRFFSLSERGPGRAFACAVTEARGENILTLDADLSSDLVFIDYALDLLKHADLVVGSKTMGSQRRTFFRVFGSQLYIACAQLSFDLTISDYSMGCKAMRRALVLPILDQLDPWTGYMTDLSVLLHRQKRKIVQVSVDCNDNRRSHFNLLHEALYRFRHLWRLRKSRNG